LKDKEKEIESLKTKVASILADTLVDLAISVGGVKVVAAEVEDYDMEALKTLGDILKDRLKSAAVILASASRDKVLFVGMATKDAVNRGLNMGSIIKETCNIVEGNGGGRAEIAQGTGRNLSKVKEALEKAVEIVKEQLKS
ncbi:MAG: DHHA1 domain-containing protein, partial [Caldanaerobacter sp.]